MTELDVEQLLYQALERVVPYADRLPPSAAAQLLVAKQAYELMVARKQIVQTPAVAKELARIDAQDPDQVGETP